MRFLFRLLRHLRKGFLSCKCGGIWMLECFYLGLDWISCGFIPYLVRVGCRLCHHLFFGANLFDNLLNIILSLLLILLSHLLDSSSNSLFRLQHLLRLFMLQLHLFLQLLYQALIFLFEFVLLLILHLLHLIGSILNFFNFLLCWFGEVNHWLLLNFHLFLELLVHGWLVIFLNPNVCFVVNLLNNHLL